MTEDLSPFYDVASGDAELVTVEGVETPAIFESSSELVLDDVLIRAPTARMPFTAAAIEGGSCTARGTVYVIRQVRHLPPDGRELLLVLMHSV